MTPTRTQKIDKFFSALEKAENKKIRESQARAKKAMKVKLQLKKLKKMKKGKK
jgi:hypothetical protein